MPQMAPISWLNLFFMFSVTFMMFCMINYFMFMPTLPKISQMKKNYSNNLNWKW